MYALPQLFKVSDSEIREVIDRSTKIQLKNCIALIEKVESESSGCRVPESYSNIGIFVELYHRGDDYYFVYPKSNKLELLHLNRGDFLEYLNK